METLKYISPEWAQEALQRLRAELSSEKMKFVTSSMVTYYTDCPDGKNRAVYYRFVEGVIDEVSIHEGARSRSGIPYQWGL